MQNLIVKYTLRLSNCSFFANAPGVDHVHLKYTPSAKGVCTALQCEILWVHIVRYLHYLLISVLLVACTSQVTQETDTTTLAGLKSITANPRHASMTENMTKIREMALKETALSLGAQSGLAARAKIINEALTRSARILDTIYNFNALILEQNILPPVLLEGRQTLHLDDAQTIRISNRTYKVAKQARFVTTPPHWQQYLWMDYKMPEVPDITLLPKNLQERAIWQYYVEKGWQKGDEQAHTILQESIARIKEDFKGMILYRKLLAMNMVSAPFVSHTDLGITGDASEIHIDDRVLRITALPALNINSQTWKAAVIKEKNKTLETLIQLENNIDTAQLNIKNMAWHPVIATIN